jgi:membrane-associated phospholipid phosphatase
MGMQKLALILGLALAAGVPAAAQSDPPSASKPVCTDLSRTVVLPCPDEEGNVTATTPAKKSDAQPAGPSPAAEPPARPPARVSSASSSPAEAAAAKEPRPPSDRSTAVEPTVPMTASGHGPERLLFRNLADDQKTIWTSPLRLRLRDVEWLAPLLGGTAVALVSDTDIERHVPTGANFRKQSNSASTYAVAGLVGVAGAGWLWGVATQNDRLRETGVLSGEAALDSFAVAYAIKSITRRYRPYESDGHGAFWKSGDSFPSEHAVAAWSIATVLAHEYPGPLTQLLAYGSAAGISAVRVTAGKHFTSDVLVGSALGYAIGRYVYHAHHGGEDIARYGTFERSAAPETPRSPENMGSAYVPLDSWVYAAFDRLSGLGYVQTAFAGLRPWTRLECVRLLDEAETALQGRAGDRDGAERLVRSLQAEFALDAGAAAGGRNVSAELESVYTRVTGIAGKPINDSYHFGQTLINDFGRPYQEGFNAVTGVSARAEAGPLAFYVRGEYQHAPSAPAPSLSVAQLVATVDDNPLVPPAPVAARNDFSLLDAYVALNIHNNQFTFGRQSLWWGPGQGGAMMFSDNAAPFYMLRWNHTSPSRLPSFLGFLGPMRTDFFIGKLEGHFYPRSPYISAQKVSFMPTENLEIGFSKASVFGGGGVPLTWRLFSKATFSYDDKSGVGTNLPGVDPGDRRSTFDFRYRIPGLRKRLILYSDSLSDDDPSPLASPRRAAINPGIYLTHVPGLPRLDFRVEAANTDPPSHPPVPGGMFIYYNSNYHDSHTNGHNLMGSWVGREGRGLQFWSTYWMGGANTVTVGYRNGRISADFIPQGGDVNDFSARAHLALPHDLFLTTSLQYERWNIPALSWQPQSNVTSMFQLTFRPRWQVK